MSGLVVYESMFGNTKRIAEAVACGLSSRMCVEYVEVSRAPAILDDDVEILVVGGPTHAFGMTRPGTRQTAAAEAGGALVSRGDGLREWLGSLTLGRRALAAAAFDTSFRKARFMGTAARAATRRLRKLGLHVIADPESFWVTGTPGPLVEGEDQRALEWGKELAATLRTRGRELVESSQGGRDGT